MRLRMIAQFLDAPSIVKEFLFEASELDFYEELEWMAWIHSFRTVCITPKYDTASTFDKVKAFTTI